MEIFENFEDEVKSCCQAIDEALIKSDYVCGRTMTLADLVIFNNVLQWVTNEKEDMIDMPNLLRWFNKLNEKEQIK